MTKKNKPIEIEFDLKLSGRNAHFVNEFTRTGLRGIGRKETIEGIVRGEIADNFLRDSQTGFLRGIKKDAKAFLGRYDDILNAARRENYIPVIQEESEHGEIDEDLSLTSCVLSLGFYGIPAYVIDSLTREGFYDGRKDLFAKSMIESWTRRNDKLLKILGIKK